MYVYDIIFSQWRGTLRPYQGRPEGGQRVPPMKSYVINIRLSLNLRRMKKENYKFVKLMQ